MESSREIGAPEFRDPAAVAAEAQRVYDICASCRRCYNLCPSFTNLLDVIDEQHDGEAMLTQAEDRRVVDLCFACQLCYPHCPYTPPPPQVSPPEHEPQSICPPQPSPAGPQPIFCFAHVRACSSAAGAGRTTALAR